MAENKVSEYDAENIFSKIIAHKEECFKVFESPTTLAFLDANPVTEGHVVVVPKLKGHTDLLSMPPPKAAAFLGDVQRIARAVKKAFDATGVNIYSNNGEDAGQTVFHPHMHIVPRTKDDGVQLGFPASKGKLAAEAAEPVQAKIEAALNPPKAPKKARFGQAGKIKPDSAGLNLQVKVVGDVTAIEGKAGGLWEVLVGDTSGCVVVSMREAQKDLAVKGSTIVIRNAAAKMIRGHIRLIVDKWGKIEASEEALEGEVEMDEKKNVSATEYELVGGK